MNLQQLIMIRPQHLFKTQHYSLLIEFPNSLFWLIFNTMCLKVIFSQNLMLNITPIIVGNLLPIIIGVIFNKKLSYKNKKTAVNCSELLSSFY